MKTQNAFLAGQAALMGLSLLLSGCSGGGGSSSTGASMYIEACSLGCGNGVGGDQISCSIVNVGPNTEIAILFSEPVDLTSVSSGTFQLVNTNNGTVPIGTYFIDEANPKRLIFRPQLTFDAQGQPNFSFDTNQTYQVNLPGMVQGDTGPYIQGTNGKPNMTRMRCTLRTTEGLIDPVPGPPVARAFVTSDGVEYELDGSTVVPPQSCEASVSLLFGDIMKVGTIAPWGEQSTTILVKIDADGDLNTPADQVVQSGTWDFPNLEYNNANLQTLAVFTPQGGSFPSAGSDLDNPRLIVVSTSDSVLDLVNNGLANPTDYAFQTKNRSFDPIELPAEGGEDFESSVGREDVLTSGGNWGSGRLTWGIGGGSGRCGPLLVRSGEELVLDTDSQLFPIPIQTDSTTPPGDYPGQLRSLLDNADPDLGAGGDYDPLDAATWPTLTVTDGNFEFTSVTIEQGGTLTFQGSNPARLFARGQILNNGRIELNGGTAPDHRSNSGGGHTLNADKGQETKYGGAAGLGSANAGDGGQGADRMNHENSTLPLMENVGGIVWDPPEVAVNVGRDGGGVGGTTPTGGRGGEHWPPTLPTTNNMASQPGFGDCEISVIPPNDSGANECGVGMVPGPGSGGAYALAGEVGKPISPFTPVNPGVLANTPADTPGGDNSVLGIEPPGDETGIFLVRHLRWVLGHLRGGSGGGGGGTGLYGGRLNAGGPPDCNNASLFPFFDHSAAGGGGGGGAVQVVAGRRLSIGGEIDCSGGNGGSALTPGQTLLEMCDHSGNTGVTADCEDFASPGGGGSGGAIKLQSQDIDIASTPERLLVAGGMGGVGVGGSIGGAGSPGLVRIEHSAFVDAPTDANIFAPWIAPYYEDGGTPPPPPGFNDPFQSAAILSLGAWESQQFRPASFSGAQSCWMQPVLPDIAGEECGVFFDLAFQEDVSADPLDLYDTKGWNMKVRYAAPSGVQEFWYRGQATAADPENPLHGIEDYETYLGTLLNHDEPTNDGSLFTVRFQGARATGILDDTCDVDLYSIDDVEDGSLTAWVRHPAHLNAFTPAPNMIRYVIIFEQRLQGSGFIEGNITGVTDLIIKVQPN